jgi:ketosteroid isomerase-like protein
VSSRRPLYSALAGLGLFLAGTGLASASPAADEAALRQLNDDYVRAFLACDVGWFRTLLADDFYGVLADGRIIDKAEFLRQAATPPPLKSFRIRDVAVRLFGDAAIVNDLASFRKADGAAGLTRYVDVYARRNGQWQVVSVQITRVALP